MKSYKYLTMACLLPILWSGSPELHAKDKEALNQQASPQLIEPCLEPVSVQDPSINRIEPIEDCDGGGGGSTGPYYPPGTPGSIKTPVYTNGSNYRVNWSSGYGYGYPVRNELYQQTNSGSWSKVYDGYGTSKYFSSPPSKQVKRYRVRSCNTKGCSGYKYSDKMIVNYKPKPNLYSKYSFLSTLDQKNATHHSTAQSFKTVIPRDQPVGQSNFSIQGSMGTTSSSDRFYLGDGYDLVRGALKETCLDVEHPDFQITKTAPLQPSTFSIDYVNDNRHLAQLLEVSASAKVGVTGDDFSLGLSGEKERYLKSVTDEQHVRFVVKVKNRREFWKLNTPTDAIYPELVNQVLSPNDNEAKADFRERCGDNFISNANLGSALYLVFVFDAKKYSYEERESKKAELGLKISDYFSIGGAAGSSTAFKQTLDNLQVSINADQVGGPQGLAASITTSNVMEKYNQFVQDTSESNWAAVDFSTNNYQRPTVYNNYSHSQIFADYRGNQGTLAQMRRWLDISVQHKERCDPWGEYGRSAPSQCSASQAELLTAMDACRDTREWSNCKHPSVYNTGSISTTPGVNLLSWLNSNVKKLNREETSKYYDHHVYKGTLYVNDQTCLSNNACFANKYRGSGVGAGNGFKITNFYWDNPKGSGRSYSISPQHCVRSEARLETRNWFGGDTTADWEYRVDFEGVCPETENFVIVQ